MEKEEEDKVRRMFELIMKRMDDTEEGIKELNVDKGKLVKKIERQENDNRLGEKRKKVKEKIEGLEKKITELEKGARRYKK